MYQEGDLCKMEAPSRTCITLNFDAAFDKDFFKSGTGIVARNAQGQVFASRSILHSNVGSTLTAEALTCSWAVKMGLVLGVTEAIIEGDSLTIIKNCSNLS